MRKLTTAAVMAATALALTSCGTATEAAPTAAAVAPVAAVKSAAPTTAAPAPKTPAKATRTAGVTMTITEPCEYEDSADCLWDAGTSGHGNGGESFASVGEDCVIRADVSSGSYTVKPSDVCDEW